MGCPSCNNPTPCKQVDCTCRVKIGTDCVTYTGDDLECSGIVKGTILTELIKQLDKFICDKFSLVTSYLSLVNVGDGSKVYKGDNNLGAKQIRSLKVSGDILTIEENTDDITFGINEEELATQIQDSQFTYDVANVGTGVDIYRDATVVGNNKTFNIRGIVSNDLDVQIDGDNIRIKTVNVDSVTQFYVNQDYSGTEDGSVVRPFSSLVKALVKAIGTTGSLAQPEYPYAQIVMQTDSVVSQAELDANPVLEGKISVNTIKIISETVDKKTILFQGNSNYPIDTEFLITKVGVDGDGKLNNRVQMEFSNIKIENSGSKGIVRHQNYHNGTLYDTQEVSQIIANDFELVSSYAPSGSYVIAKDSLGNDLLAFGVPVRVQDSIVNDTPHVYVYGYNFDGEGAFKVNNVKISGTSQTLLMVRETSMTVQNMNFSFNVFYMNTEDKTSTDGNYTPKDDVFYIDTENSYLFIGNFQETSYYKFNEQDLRSVGGVSAILKVSETGTPRYSYTRLNEGYIFGNKVNYLVRTDSDSGIELVNCKFENCKIDIRAFNLEDTPSGIKDIYVQGSTINTVGDPTVTNIQPSATFAIINGYQFTSSPEFTDDTAAIAAGLISGNIYYNTTLGGMKKVA